jgi:hypothetical protein
MKRDIYKEFGDINLCIDFEVLKVKVPIIFFGTQGFSARRVFRHAGRDVTTFVHIYSLITEDECTSLQGVKDAPSPVRWSRHVATFVASLAGSKIGESSQNFEPTKRYHAL